MGCIPVKSTKPNNPKTKPPSTEITTKPTLTKESAPDKQSQPLESVPAVEIAKESASFIKQEKILESLFEMPPALDDVDDGDVVDLPTKMVYSVKGIENESNQDYISMGKKGKIRSSGIDENGGFFKLRGRLLLDGKVYMEKTYVGIDDEKIVFKGFLDKFCTSGNFWNENSDFKGNFSLIFIGTLWESDKVYTILLPDSEELCGIGKDAYGYGLWKWSISKTTCTADIFYTDGKTGRFSGLINGNQMHGTISNHTGDVELVFNKA